jgi:putative ABC transport system permease protein
MNIKYFLKLSFKALLDRKLRSALTILMVVVGSSLMVSLNGLIAGLQSFVEGAFNKLAPNVLVVSSFLSHGSGTANTGSSGTRSSSVPSFFGQGLISTPIINLDSTIINKIKSLPYVQDIIPSYQGIVSIESKSSKTNTTAEPRFTSVLSIDPQKLNVIAPSIEFEDRANSSFISGTTNRFPSILLSKDIAGLDARNPFAKVGQSVTLRYFYIDPTISGRKENSQTFTVVGIMKPIGNPTIDRAVVISTESGGNLFYRSGKYDSLFVIAKSADFVDRIEREIRDVYGNDIGITTSKAILNTIKQFTSGFSIFISSIALISLLVGAVGIVTTMYTSVVERTKEIGVMKAIGAKNGIVLGFFLMESLIIGILGASVGLVLGIAGSYLLTKLFSTRGGEILSVITPVFLLSDLLFVWVVSVALSLVAGVYPAWKASRLSPITALRRD